MATSNSPKSLDLPAIIQESLGARISMLRRQSGMTQQDLATMLGVSRSTVAVWETDRNTPPGHELISIADILKVPVEVFLNGMMSLDLQQTVSTDEAILLSLYRNVSMVGRIALLRAADRLSRSAEDHPGESAPRAIRIRGTKAGK